MDTNWTHRGNKFFLPKIEYTRLSSSTAKLPEWSSNAVASELNDESVVGETNNDRNGIERYQGYRLFGKQARHDRPAGMSFPKFSVLPPIQDQRDLHRKHYKQIKSVEEFEEENQSDERELNIRRKGILLRRQTALLAGEKDGETKSKSAVDLRVHGQGCTRNYQTGKLLKDQNEYLKISRPIPDASSVWDLASDSAQRKAGYNRLASGDGYSHAQARSAKFRRFNSDSTHNDDRIHRNKARSVSPQGSMPLFSPFDSATKRELSVDIPGSRPISRCHIDINMNDTGSRPNQEATEKAQIAAAQSYNNTAQNTIGNEQNPASSAPPLVQITTEDSSSGIADEPNGISKRPSIQILIDTLDSAKNEIPEKLELPQMSIREQRRRSALCRVNSKQVDDFLLVHNLKDLGLL